MQRHEYVVESEWGGPNEPRWQVRRCRRCVLQPWQLWYQVPGRERVLVKVAAARDALWKEWKAG